MTSQCHVVYFKHSQLKWFKKGQQMASLNKVLLIGNLTKDPELNKTPNGTAVTNLRIAVNRRFKDRSGTLKDDTCFITVTAWDKQAEICYQHLKKSSLIMVEGILQSRTWGEDKGQKRSTVDVRAERVQFLRNNHLNDQKEEEINVQDMPSNLSD